MTTRIRSAFSICFRARNTPSTSTSSAPCLIPAVSITLTGTPWTLMRPSMESLVVPATSCTMALSSSRRALSRLDLPTLGVPAITTDSPAPRATPSFPVASRAPALWAPLWRILSTYLRSRSPASSSSGKSIASSRTTFASRRSFFRECAAFPIAPSTWLSIAFRAASVDAWISRATASAWERSIRPLRKALRVNSPGSASLAPPPTAASRRARIMRGPPWAVNSTMSSPV